MPKPAQLEFLLVRYVPDVVRREFVNIGVILFEGARTHIRFTKDWRTVHALDPNADIATLQALEWDLNAQLTSGVLDRAVLVTKFRDYFTSGIEMTPVKGVLAEDAASELETLARLYLERRRAVTRESSGRAAILAQMKDAFEQAGVWALMTKHIAAAQYTHRGDPLKIDCGYRPNGVIKMFQAVSLATDADAAKVLAFSYPDLRDGMARVEKARTELTAIIDPDLNREDEQIAFALAVLHRHDIGFVPTTDLPRIADAVRRDLRV